MLTYKPMIERMARAAEDDGEGLGKYVANEVKLQLLSKVNEDMAMLTPCLRRLEREVERTCPVVMQMTKEGMRTHYGLTLEPDEVFVAAANRTTVVAFALQLTEVDLPDVSDIPPAALWHGISKAIDHAKHDWDVNSWSANSNLLTFALLARMGAVGFRNLYELTSLIREQRTPLAVAIACVAGSVGNQAAGGLITIPMPIIPALEEDAA